MRSSALLALSLALLLAVPCFAQRQLAFPVNPERGGFPPGHPGIPIIVDVSEGKAAAWNADALTLGDSILLELTGKPALSYLKLVGYQVPDSVRDDGFCAPLEARVIAADDERVLAEFQTPLLPKDSDTPRIVTVASSVVRSDIVGPSRYRSPIGDNDTASKRKVDEMRLRHESLPRIRLDSFDRVKIRVWELVDEIGG